MDFDNTNKLKLNLSSTLIPSLNSSSIPSPSYILGPSKQLATINGFSKLSSKLTPHFTSVASFIHRRAGRISRSPSPEKNFTKKEFAQESFDENILGSKTNLIGPVYLSSRNYSEKLKQNDINRSCSVDIKTTNKLTECKFSHERNFCEENKNLKKQISELKELLFLKEEENRKLRLKIEFIQKDLIGNTFGDRGSLPPLKVKSRDISKSILKEYKDDSIILYLCGDCNEKNEGEFSMKKCLWKPNESVARTLLKEWKISYACIQGRRANKTMVNQDDFCITKLSNNNFLIGVFDGHGRYGHKIAAIVRQKIMRGLHNIVLKKNDLKNKSSENSLSLKNEDTQHIYKSNRKVDLIHEIFSLFDNTQLLLEKENLFESSGTSATVALIESDRIIMIQLGSSGGKVIDSSSGEIIYKTPQHSLYNIQEKTRILSKGATIKENNKFSFNSTLFQNNFSFSMTRSLGDNAGRILGISHKPEIWEMKIEKGDSLILILATDGYLEHFEKINYNKIYIQEELDSAVKKCQNIWIKTTDNASVDDITVIACGISI